MYHMSIVFDEWTDIIPHLTEEETKDKTNAEHIEDINGVMNAFHSTVAIELARIIKNIADKVCTLQYSVLSETSFLKLNYCFVYQYRFDQR